MEEENLIVLRTYDSVNDAEWDSSILQGEGIWSMISNEIMSSLYPTGVIPAQLIVRAEDKARAKEILEAYSEQ